MNDRIRKLQEEIRAEESKMARCSHTFGEPYSNPETVREGYGHKTITQGSDVWGEYEGYRDVEKPRWTRKCTKCGKEEHTYKQKPVIRDYKPDFD